MSTRAHSVGRSLFALVAIACVAALAIAAVLWWVLLAPTATRATA